MAVEPVGALEMERKFQADDCDDAKKMSKKSFNESKKLWEIAAPAIITAVSQFSIGFVSVAFVGHLGSLELAAISVVQNVIEGFVYGVMLGMGSALETLCGQAVGAERFDMLGIYLQRSCVITLVTSLFLTPFYVFTSPILKLLHQDKRIAEIAGKYAIWVIPQLYAYALNFPVQKFLQAQSKIWVMTIINVVVLVFHIVLNWVLVTKLGHGLLGAAMAGNISWWLVVLAQNIYVISGFFPESWTGFSILAFKSLWNFVKLSLASAVMLCLELWYFTVVILMVGWLKNPEIKVDAVSTSLDLQLWVLMITLGFNAAISVRVSNELGAGRPKAAKFSVVIAVITSTIVGVVFTVAVIATKNYYPRMFSDKPEVLHETSKLSYFLAATIFLMSIQPILHGVAVGAGWQYSVAIINVVCYYIIGLPLGACLGYIANIGVNGIWTGMLVGTLLQTLVLMYKMWKVNWRKEAIYAEERIRTYGDQPSQDGIEQTGSRGTSPLPVVT
ncbi:protein DETOXIFICATION 33-like isoform X1 [Nicotiana tabacum]|uniref:Protein DETOXIFICATION n=2 Tax=Nicotiana tabacum TaxID=4097 RepID=A0A1S3XID6_TOBAC|nr:protein DETOXIFICATION 33-like isoform X1 [Nicotiana tomentosiformis]XP_016439614.1 PREDICTED: protein DETOXIFICATION 33-like [Nicotiana tabacum]